MWFDFASIGRVVRTSTFFRGKPIKRSDKMYQLRHLCWQDVIREGLVSHEF